MASVAALPPCISQEFIRDLAFLSESCESQLAIRASIVELPLFALAPLLILMLKKMQNKKWIYNAKGKDLLVLLKEKEVGKIEISSDFLLKI